MIEIGIIKDTPENKIIDIRDKDQVIKAKYAIGKDDVLKYTLMGEHYIEISFEFNKHIAFNRSDYIQWKGDKYTLRDNYQPEQVNKRKYKYTLKFEAVEMFFQDMQYWYLGQGLKESEWRMAGNPEYFLKYVVENANRYFGTTDFKVGTVEPTERKDITFSTNTNTFDALTQIAEQYESEWYLTGKTLHLLNKISFGDEVNFETEVSVLSMKRQNGESTTRYTRILALGSERNLTKDYRETNTDEAVDAIYPKRLRIPQSKGDVIDVYPDMSPDEVIEGTVIFDEVYPKRVGTIETVGTIEYQDKDEDTGKVTKWNAYKFTDSGINFKKEYLLTSEDELRLKFVSGNLNGFDFALKFHENKFSATDNSQYFEIFRSEDYGKMLPNDIMKPKAGDEYVMYGFNIALVSDIYVPNAENELYKTAKEWIEKNLRDTSVYECPTVIGYFMKHEMDLTVGQKVKLVFDNENITTRSSRIMGFEKKLYNLYDATYTIGDNAAYSRLSNIENSIKELQIAGVTYESKGGNGVYLIKQFDSTTPTDFNTYSAKASDAKFFNKQTGGTIQGDTLFQKNMQVQGVAISDVFQNSTFTAGQLGNGFQLKRDANGQSYIEVDNLLVRREAVFNRLTIAEIKSVGGTILLSLASMLLSKVEVKDSTWKCFFDTADGTIPNDFDVNDQVICRKYIGQNIKYYWALVTAVGADYIELSKTDKDGLGTPAIGDEVIQLGNRKDVNRQYAIMLSAYGSDAPSIKQYAGINTYNLTGKEVTVLSPKGNKFTGDFIVSTNGTTAPVYKERGVFANGTTYYLNDRVSYLGSYWLCIVNSTITTPNETSVTWRKETAGQTDIDKTVNEARSEFNAQFIILDDKIASKVSQTDFNALGERVSTAESSVTQLSGSITSIVEKVDNISIGGRNLLRNSNFADAKDYWGTNGVDSWQILSDATFGNISKIQTSVIGRGIYQTITIPRQAGANYAISVYLKADTPMKIQLGHEGGTGTKIVDVTDQWQRYDTKGVWNTKGAVTLYARDIGTFYVANAKYEEGNVVSAWSIAPEDIQQAIDKKNKTYYQDLEPSIPSQGHKPGDIWFKKSLVDSSGNINADTTKNNYQLQYRWDGVTWKQINWSASKSKIEQTDKNITSIVEKTGIDNLGNGETLMSVINQTPEKITLAVEALNIGGRNYFAYTDWVQGGYFANTGKLVANSNATRIRPSKAAYAEASSNVQYCFRNNNPTYLAYIYELDANGNVLKEHGWKDGDYKFTTKPTTTHFALLGRKADNSNITPAEIWKFMCKLEKGDKFTDYTPAPEDIPEIAASKLSIEENKISLSSKTIELNGDTIAKSIEAKDLKVGSRSGLSALEVLKDGTFYAKGSTSSNSALIIDSGTQSITITSPKSISGVGESISGTSNVTISSLSGGVRVDGSTAISPYSTAVVSNSGIFANTAGQGMFPPSIAINSKASIVGLGWGNVDKDSIDNASFVAGVYGSASNSGSAPGFGGYFDMLKVNGLILNTIIIKESHVIEKEEVMINSYANDDITVTMPNNPYTGQTHFIRGVSKSVIKIKGNDYKIWSDKSYDDIWVDSSKGDSAMMVFDGNYWQYYKMVR